VQPPLSTRPLSSGGRHVLPLTQELERPSQVAAFSMTRCSGAVLATHDAIILRKGTVLSATPAALHRVMFSEPLPRGRSTAQRLGRAVGSGGEPS
jgi:hypothetical protein